MYTQVFLPRQTVSKSAKVYMLVPSADRTVCLLDLQIPGGFATSNGLDRPGVEEPLFCPAKLLATGCQ